MSGQYPGNFGPGQGVPGYGAPPGPSMPGGGQPHGQPHNMYNNGPPGWLELKHYIPLESLNVGVLVGYSGVLSTTTTV